MKTKPKTAREPSKIASTIAYLRRCQAARAAGHLVSFTTDPAWLVQMAINRRAGWPDDPGFTRGSAMPVEGRYPKKASGDAYRHLRLLADIINSRVIVREGELGEWRVLIMRRLPGRIHGPEDD